MEGTRERSIKQKKTDEGGNVEERDRYKSGGKEQNKRRVYSNVGFKVKKYWGQGEANENTLHE